MVSQVQSSKESKNFFHSAYDNASWALTASLHKVQSAVRATGRAIYNTYDYVYARNPVSGNREFWYLPLMAEQVVGNLYYDTLCSSNGGLSTDQERTAKVREIGRRLSFFASRSEKLAFHFRLLDSRAVNAWALPNGKIAIYEGMLDEIYRKNSVIEGYDDITLDDKLAAVLSHEIVHSSARHSIKALEKTILFQIVVILVRLVAIPFLMTQKDISDPNISEDERKQRVEDRKKLLGFVDMLFEKFSDFAFELYQLSHSRSCEFEADRYGMYYMKKAGFNPRAALWLQELFERKNPSFESKTLRYIRDLVATHPSSVDRLEANRKTLNDLNNNFPFVREN